jgi:hypothetical protein
VKRSVTISKRFRDFVFGLVANRCRFHDFFNHLDHYRTDYFLWVTAEGIAAAKQSKTKNVDISEDEADPNGGEG